jgi:hypothetical protein
VIAARLGWAAEVGVGWGWKGSAVNRQQPFLMSIRSLAFFHPSSPFNPPDVKTTSTLNIDACNGAREKCMIRVMCVESRATETHYFFMNRKHLLYYNRRYGLVIPAVAVALVVAVVIVIVVIVVIAVAAVPVFFLPVFVFFFSLPFYLLRKMQIYSLARPFLFSRPLAHSHVRALYYLLYYSPIGERVYRNTSVICKNTRQLRAHKCCASGFV